MDFLEKHILKKKFIYLFFFSPQKKMPCLVKGCKNTHVLENNYCIEHQYHAIDTLIKKLKLLNQKVKNLQNEDLITVDDKKNIEMIKQHILQVQKKLFEDQKNCSSDQKCFQGIVKILLHLDDMEYLPPELVKIRNEVMVNAKPLLQPDHVIDTQIEFLKEKNEQLNQKEYDAQVSMMEKAAMMEQKELDLQKEISRLSQLLNETKTNYDMSQNLVEELKKQIHSCAVNQEAISATYSEAIENAKKEAKEKEEKYLVMQSREIELGKQIEIMSENQQKLAQTLESLEENHKKKVEDLREQFEQKMYDSSGNTIILSSREKELLDEISRLKSDLEKTLTDLKIATDAGQEILQDVKDSYQPYSGVARQLKSTNDQLRQKNEELAKMQAETDNLRDMLARMQITCAETQEQMTAKDRYEVQKLSEERAILTQKLAGREQDIASMQAQIRNLEIKSQQERQGLNGKITMLQHQLNELEVARMNEKRNVENQMNLIKTKERNTQLDLEFKYNQLNEKLNQEFLAKRSELENKYDMTRRQLDNERRNLQYTQQQVQETGKILATEKMKLDKYQQDLQQKMVSFYKQRDELDTALKVAQDKIDNLSSIESDYRKRLALLQTQLLAERERFTLQIRDLDSKLKQAVDQKNEIAHNIEKCSAHRETMIQKLNAISDENTRLKNQNVALQTEMDVMKSSYDAKIEKYRLDMKRMQEEVGNCSQRLQEASIVHDHVKEMHEQAQQLRQELESKILHSKQQEAMLRKIMKDRSMETHQILDLQQKLRDASIEKQEKEIELKNLKDQLSDLNKKYKESSKVLNKLSQEYENAIKQEQLMTRKALLYQQKKEKELQVRNMLQDNEIQTQNQQIKNLQESNIMQQNTLADTEYEHARQIDRMVRSQQKQLYNISTDHVNTGSSNLLTEYNG